MGGTLADRTSRCWPDKSEAQLPETHRRRYLFEAMAVGRAEVTIRREVPGATDQSAFRISVEVH